MRALLHALLCALLLGLAPATVRAADGGGAHAGGSPATQSLYVGLVVNGDPRDDIIPLTVTGNQLIVAASDLRDAGLLFDAGDTVDLAHMPGVQAEYDGANQRLILDLDPVYLPVSRVDGDKRVHVHSIASTGALMNYDFYAQRSAGTTTASLWSEQRVFGPLGNIANTGVFRFASGDPKLPRGYLRYDTRFRYVDEDRTLTATVGDLITRSLPWSSSVRIGGVQIGTDYRVRPDLVTMPLPSFAGEAEVPSSVDLFIDGYRQQNATVQPGRFVLDNVPVVNGRGEATVVTTDAVGRQVRTTVPFYVSSELLKRGFTDFSAEAGLLRRGYGLQSFNYGPPVASGTFRRGLSDRLTVEGHAEVSARLALAGGGVVWAPGLLGTVNLTVAASTGNQGTGAQVQASWSYNGRGYSVQLQHIGRSIDYRDLSNFDLHNVAGMKSSERAIGSLSLGRSGSFSLAYIDQAVFGSPRARIASLSYSRSFRQMWTLSATADRDLAHGATTIQARLAIPFGRSAVSAGIERSAGRGMLYEANYSHAMPSQGGVAVMASGATSGDGTTYGQAEALWRTELAQVQVGGSVAGGQRATWGGVTGTIATLKKHVFVANQVGDAFVVVSTGKTPDVPVYFENQKVGRTNGDGLLFVPQVTAYQPSLYALDPLVLGIGDSIGDIDKRVSIRSGAGAVIQMPVIRARAVSVALVDEAGKPLAAGGRARRSDQGVAVIGWDGLVFLDRVGDHVDLDVTRRDGKSCRAGVVIPHDVEALERLAPVTCS